MSDKFEVDRCSECQRLKNFSIARLIDENPVSMRGTGNGSGMKQIVANLLARDAGDNSCVRLTDLVGEVAQILHRDPKAISVQVRQAAEEVGSLLTFNLAEGRRTFVTTKTRGA